MLYHPLLTRFFLSLLCFSMIAGCKKTGSTATGTADGGPPAITAVGIPISSPVTKTIGAAGGTITSGDGRIDLIIPAGALPADVDIAIQPITNQCPGGVGIAYDLQPDGTKFLQPATLVFHYSDDDINGTDPYFLDFPYQDSTHEWVANDEKDVDTIAKTISYDINHFTPYGPSASLMILVVDQVLSEKQTTEVKVNQVLVSSKKVAGFPDLRTLPITKLVPSDDVHNWKISGTGNGIISPSSGNPSDYAAPDQIATERQAYISATIGNNVTTPTTKNRKGAITELGVRHISASVTLVPKTTSFSVKLEENWTQTSHVYADHYHDGATFQVDVDIIADEVTIPQSKIVNQPPTVTNPSGSGGDIEATWVPDDNGLINIQGLLSGTITLDRYSKRIVFLALDNTGSVIPKWTISEHGVTAPIGGGPWPDLESLTFYFKDGVQTIDPGKGTLLEGRTIFTVTQLHH